MNITQVLTGINTWVKTWVGNTITTRLSSFYDDNVQPIENKISSQARPDNKLLSSSEISGMATTIAEGAAANAVSPVSSRVSTIEGKIPAQATASNQLADKAFVNSSIATATATYRGNFNLISDLNLAINATHDAIATKLKQVVSTADSNDYCFVIIPTSASTPTQIASIDRYKYNGTSWSYEYTLNNSGYTDAQWKAINSGITSTLVGMIKAATASTIGLVKPGGTLSVNEVGLLNVHTAVEEIDQGDDVIVRVGGLMGNENGLSINLPETVDNSLIINPSNELEFNARYAAGTGLSGTNAGKININTSLEKGITTENNILKVGLQTNGGLTHTSTGIQAKIRNNGDGISIDNATGTISVKPGSGISVTGNGVTADVRGVETGALKLEEGNVRLVLDTTSDTDGSGLSKNIYGLQAILKGSASTTDIDGKSKTTTVITPGNLDYAAQKANLISTEAFDQIFN